ncbi:hypothetical protein HDU88_003268 [Geranomyces variabilis]|nr:hypothetical protein HDU88_003268 [Geranomyces variabilis]
MSAPSPAVPAANVCLVCQVAPSKYKCSTCRLPYCSLACYKVHKAVPCSAPVPTEPEPKSKPPRNNNEEDDTSRLSEEQLAKLANSKELKSMVADPHLKRLLEAIDSSPDPERAYDDAMAREPAFQDFVGRTLETVSPPDSHDESAAVTKKAP